MQNENLELNEDYKTKPVESWTMWDMHCYEFFTICEEHDKNLLESES